MHNREMLRILLLLLLAFPVLTSAAVSSSAMPYAGATPSERTLRLGMQGADVRAVQEELQFLLASSSRFAPTGYFGIKTQTAVREFQAQSGIVQAGSVASTGYGQVGPKTRLTLRLRKIARTCTDESKPSRQACLQTFYGTFAQEQGTRAALTLIEGQVASEPYFNVRCHAVMHEIGHHAAREFGTLGTAFVAGSATCQNGYYHGVVEALLGNREVASVAPEELQKFCLVSGVGATTTLGTLNCVHGIGHALIYMTDDDLPLSLLRCGDMRTDEHRSQCATGAYMQHWFADQLRGDTEGVSVNLDGACMNILGDQETCWLTQSATEIAQSIHGTSTALRYCERLETSAHRELCTASIAR